MSTRRIDAFGSGLRAGCAVILGFWLVALAGCTQEPTKPAVESKPAAESKYALKRVEPGKEFSGFLQDYSKLKPNEKLGGEALSYVNPDKMKSLHRYVAIIVDPVQVYVSTAADPSLIPDSGRGAVAKYFEHALIEAVSDAFPVVDSAGPLTLRLRAALVGIDLGGAVAPLNEPAMAAKSMERAIVLEKVSVEMELVDSETGERIAAAVDKQNLGAGAEVGSENFSRMERFNEAKRAFDQWAGRVREFLDSEHELTGEDAERALKSYEPYGK
jgi:uncharacterized protein DUF3313